MRYIIIMMVFLTSALYGELVLAQPDSEQEEISQHYEIEEYEKERKIELAEEHEKAPELNAEYAHIQVKNPGTVPVSDQKNDPESLKLEKVDGSNTIPAPKASHKSKKGNGFFAKLATVAGEVAVQVSTERSCNTY